MAEAFFTVVTIALNHEAGLRATGESLRCQRCGDYVWVVVDGGSKDGSAAYLQACEDPRLNWCSEGDAGRYDAMNKGIERSRGRYLVFMNGGDTFADETTLEQVKTTLTKAPADVLYGDALEIGADGRPRLKRAFSHHKIYYSMFTHHQSIFYRRAALGDLRYDAALEISGDRALTARLYKMNKSFRHFPRPLSVFASGGVSQSRDPEIRRRMYQERRHVLRDILGVPRPVVFALLGTKKAADALRHGMPSVYNWLRFGKPT